MKTKHITLKGFYNEDTSILEVGVDEVGRGSLAGPVTIAACIMPRDFSHPLVKDSKLLNEPQRKEAREIVLEYALYHSVVHIDVDDIEQYNILGATMLGMERALSVVYDQTKFDFMLIDGDKFRGFQGIPYKTIVGGDNKYVSIAAASILAKTERDSLMKKIDLENLGYGWNSNKGYGTKSHINAIQEMGPCEHHRPSFISHLINKTEELF